MMLSSNPTLPILQVSVDEPDTMQGTDLPKVRAISFRERSFPFFKSKRWSKNQQEICESMWRIVNCGSGGDAVPFINCLAILIRLL